MFSASITLATLDGSNSTGTLNYIQFYRVWNIYDISSVTTQNICGKIKPKEERTCAFAFAYLIFAHNDNIYIYFVQLYLVKSIVYVICNML